MIEGKAVARFGTGDILITPMVKTDFSGGFIVLQNKGTHTVGEQTQSFEPGDDDTVLSFDTVESLEVLIERLQKLKDMMSGDARDCYKEIEYHCNFGQEGAGDMTLKKFAQMLDGREYDYLQFTSEEIQIAKENGFVIVCGVSDDLMEFEGAIRDDGGCFEGGEVFFNKTGVVFPEGDEQPNNCSQITALWCKEKDENGTPATWAYQTDIPHETFKIWEDGELYCIGIVFSIADVR